MAGRHANTGERGQVQENGSVYLTEMLFLIPHRSESETVELSFPRAGQLDVSIAAPGFPPRVLSLRRKADDFKCKGGSLMITPSAEWTHGFANAVPIVAGESVTMKVDLIGDGLLVTRQDAQFMWVPFPFRTTWSSWYRFLPAATSEPVP